MRWNQLWLIVGILSFVLSGQAFAPATTPAYAQESVSHLLVKEEQLQIQIRDLHKDLRQISKRIKETDGRITTTLQQLSSLKTHEEQIDQELADQYGILLLPVLSAFQDNTAKTSREMFQDQLRQLAAEKKQLLHSREQLLQKESNVQLKWKTVSDQLAKTTNEPPHDVSLEGLDLEQLAALFAWPVPTTKQVSSDYGWRNLNGDVEFHSGIDVAADEGDPIYASADGIVLYAGPAQGFGHWIVIRHQQGLLTIYGHMYRSGVKVKPGQTVKKGQLIGRVGADGQSYGPHLHFAVARGISNGLPNTVNPWYFLEN